jgi:hypothetical protein
MGKQGATVADPTLVYVPPSQQAMPGPVSKPGELLPEVAEQFLKDRLAYAAALGDPEEAAPKSQKAKK